jgi:cytochrome c oxidase subunit 2
MTSLFAQFMLPTKASSFAGEVDWLYWFIMWVTLIFSMIIFGGVAYLTWRFRHRPGTNDIGRGPTHSNLLEIVWSVIPLIIVLMIAVWGFKGYMNITELPPANDGDTLDINIEAYKWGWSFIYPNGYSESNLHVPLNTKVRLTQTSRDVLHSFFIPQFRVKKDVVPGRFNKHWFTAVEISPMGKNLQTGQPLDWAEPDSFNIDVSIFVEGSDAHKKASDADRAQMRERMTSGFDIYCTEYCGTGHSTMRQKVYVHPDKASFNAWLAKASDVYRVVAGKEPTAAEVGNKLVKNNGCLACHSLDGSAGTGPPWKNLYGKKGKFTDGGDYDADENYIRESILYPGKKLVAGYGGAMPSYLGKFSDRDLFAIIAYQKTLSDAHKNDPAVTQPTPPLNQDRSKTK